MRSQGKSYLIAALLGALLAAGCASGPTDEVAQTRASSRVLDAYDVPDLLAQAAPAVSQSLENNLPDDVGAAERQRLRDVVFEVYAAESLRNDVGKRLRESAAEAGRQEELASAADALDTPLVTRMIELEASTGDDNFAEGFNAFVEQPADDARKQRLQKIDTLSANMQIIDLQTGFNLTLLEAMIRARNAASAAQYQVDEPQIERMLANTRDGIRGKLEQRVPLMLLYVYRDVDEATLEEYVELQARPDMAWTNQALEQSIIGALAAAGERIPERFNTAP